MNTNQYTQKTLEALQAAQQLAVEYQHNQLEPEHLLHALASQEQGLIPQLLQKLNVDPGSFAAAVAEKLSALPRVSGSGRDPDKVYISQAADKVLSAAAREAKAMKDDYISVEHVFLGLLDEQTQNTTELFRAFSITKDKFLQQLTAVRGNQRVTNDNPEETYRMFGAVMDVDGEGGLKPISADFDLADSRFSPTGSQEEPELADRQFSPATAHVLGAQNSAGLAIQRVDLLQHGVNEFHDIARNTSLGSVEKAQRAMQVIESICDPELTDLASQVTSALIDGKDTPDFTFTLADDLDKERLRARDMLFSGQADQAIEAAEAAVAHLDQVYAAGHGVPRYFNSYAERVVYNRLFATLDERTVLIPDNLFYAHMELADVLSQIKGAEAAIPHLNRMVAYAPAYPLSHLKLAIQLARNEDWDSARAACLNALRVALDRDDAAFAYYRFAYAEWMLDRFDTAAAAYIMSDHIAPGAIGSLESELQELVSRADSQCIPVPESVEAAAHVLATHDLPVWPHIEVADIVRDAARVCVDEGMFVPARTLSVAVARMNDGEGDNIDIIQAQFLRSLSA